jgi:hypothetical protein
MKILHISNPVHGWIDITFGQEPDAYTVTASDVPNDCLRDLAAAIVRLNASSNHETVEFSIEPGFVTCDLFREIDSLRMVFRNREHATSAFETVFPFNAFSKRLRFELLRIQSAYVTEEGWTQPFPHREVSSLS